jgi:hypothetical protein
MVITRRASLSALLMPLLTRHDTVSAEGRLPPPGSINVLDHIPPALHMLIRSGEISTDLAPFYARAFAAGDVVHFPAGTYTHTTFSLPPGKTLLGDGAKTVFRQLAGAKALDCVFAIETSNVTIGDCAIEGIIHLFDHTRRNADHPVGPSNSEFNHGIAIRAPNEGQAVRNIAIGNVIGRNLRGDVVSIYCNRAAKLEGVRIASVRGENILRNGLSIVGGRNISVAAIDGTAFGYAAMDIEPEGQYSAPVEDVTVGSVRGALVQIAANPDTFVDRVVIDRLDTDPGYAVNSTPPYRNAAGQIQLDTSAGLRIRNALNIRVGTHRARNHRAHAVLYGADPDPLHAKEPRIEIGRIDYAAIGSQETEYLTLIQASGVRDLVIRGGTATMAKDAQRLVLGTLAGAGTRCTIDNVRTDGLIAAYVRGSRFSNIRTTAPGSRGFTLGVEGSQFQDCEIRAAFLGYNTTGCVFDRVTFTQTRPGYVLGGKRANRFRNSSVAGIRIADGPYGG